VENGERRTHVVVSLEAATNTVTVAVTVDVGVAAVTVLRVTPRQEQADEYTEAVEQTDESELGTFFDAGVVRPRLA